MTEQTHAETLRISEGSVVWIIGTTVEETSLLDPLPEGTEVIEERGDDDFEVIDAALVVTDDRAALAETFDEVLPQLGSIPLVWVSYAKHADIDQDAIESLLDDYGWYAAESVALDETWAALRIEQS